jgi:Ca2+-binding EF-hand superfamily protein
MKEKKEVQPFEIAVARKLEARSNSLLDTFLHLDTDGDGLVTRNDLKAALHNLWGIDLSKDEMNAFFSVCPLELHHHELHHHGIRYPEFLDTAPYSHTSSASANYKN